VYTKCRNIDKKNCLLLTLVYIDLVMEQKYNNNNKVKQILANRLKIL